MRIYVVLLMAILVTPVNLAAHENHYPTMDVVRYVLDCMAELGSQTEENLYTCSCRLDAIETTMPFERYERATFFERYSRMPGKRGGLVRDSEDGERLRVELRKAKEKASAQCIQVKHIEVKKDSSEN